MTIKTLNWLAEVADHYTDPEWVEENVDDLYVAWVEVCQKKETVALEAESEE